ncbi:uncharacterized protein LOC143149241 isoform X2 [Ptiloglossa arizonensis]|uniref:uncharacterized protein LOC143149241 isoform X2 n=1 Tax=Ptiloglossa arizonensis TaxID=3350558 RepID=UPI003F9F647A
MVETTCSQRREGSFSWALYKGWRLFGGRPWESGCHGFGDYGRMVLGLQSVSLVRLVHVYSGIRQYREFNGNGRRKVAAGRQTDENVVDKEDLAVGFVRLGVRPLSVGATVSRLGKLRSRSRKRVLQRVLGGPRSSHEKRQLHRVLVRVRTRYSGVGDQHQLRIDSTDFEKSPEESRFARKTGGKDHENGRSDDSCLFARLVPVRSSGDRRSVFRRKTFGVRGRASGSAGQVLHLLQPHHLRGPEQPVPSFPEEDIRDTEIEDHGAGESEHGPHRPEQAGGEKLREEATNHRHRRRSKSRGNRRPFGPSTRPFSTEKIQYIRWTALERRWCSFFAP